MYATAFNATLSVISMPRDAAPTPLPTVSCQVHVATFATHTDNQCGTFRSTAERLDYLAELGINGICLMPISQDAHPNHKEEFSCWG